MSEKETERIENGNEKEIVKVKRQSLLSRYIAKKKLRKEERKALAEKDLSETENRQIEEKLEEVEQEIVETRSPKRKRITAIYWVVNVLIILGILLWNIFSADNFEPLEMFEIDNRYFLIALGFVVAIVLTDVFSVHRMIYRNTLRSRWATSFKSVAIYRLSPFAAGGQPFMTSYLTSRDIPPMTAISIPVTKLLFQNIAWIIITTICMICSFSMHMGVFISAISVIAFVITVLIVVGIMLISVSKKIGQKLVGAYVKVMVKLKLWKDYDKHYERIMGNFDDYQSIMRDYTKDFFDVVLQLFLAAARYIMIFSIPFFIFCAFKGYTPEVFSEFFVLTALIDLTTHIIPLPGGGGLNIITFAWLFSNYLGGSTFWAMLVWQFCTFYFYLLQGVFVIAYDTLYGNRKYRWVQKKRILQKESQEFRKMQIDNFRSEREKRRKKETKSVTFE